MPTAPPVRRWRRTQDDRAPRLSWPCGRERPVAAWSNASRREREERLIPLQCPLARQVGPSISERLSSAPRMASLSTPVSRVGLGGPEAVIDQPRDRGQGPVRPPAFDDLAVDALAVPGGDVREMFGVSQGEDSEVVHRVAGPGLRPVDDARDLLVEDEDVVGLQVVVRERRRAGAQHALRPLAVVLQHLEREGLVRLEPCAGVVERWTRSSRDRPGHGGRAVSCTARTAAPAAAHDAGPCGDGRPNVPGAVPRTRPRASTGCLRHRTCGVGTSAIAATSASIAASSGSTFRNTSSTRRVTRAWCATSTRTSSRSSVRSRASAAASGVLILILPPLLDHAQAHCSRGKSDAVHGNRTTECTVTVPTHATARKGCSRFLCATNSSRTFDRRLVRVDVARAEPLSADGDHTRV